MKMEHMAANDFQRKYAFSPAVITEGGRTVWMSGQTALRDGAGNDLSGQLEAQARTIFDQIDATLRQLGGSLANVVTMTVYVTDPRFIDRFAEVRRPRYPDGKYPCSTFLTVAALPMPGMVIEIQATAVI